MKRPGKALQSIADKTWDEGMRLASLASKRALSPKEARKLRKAAETVLACIAEHTERMGAAQ